LESSFDFPDNKKNILSDHINQNILASLNDSDNVDVMVGGSFLSVDLVEHSHLFKNETHEGNSGIPKLNEACQNISDISIRTGEDDSVYSIYTLPVFVLSKSREKLDQIDSFKIIPAHSNVRQNIYGFFESLSIESLCIGFGFNDLLNDSLSNDFESLFSLRNLIDNTQNSMFKPYEIAFIEEEGVVVIPFLSLTAMKNVWHDDVSSMLDKYVLFTKNFRTTLNILRMMDRPYRVVKTNSSFFATSDIDDKTKQFILKMPNAINENGRISDSVLSGPLINDNWDVDDVSLTAYENIEVGIIASIVTWSSNNRPIMKKVIYPTCFDTDAFVSELCASLQDSLTTATDIHVKTKDFLENETNLINGLVH
jgi:hypothetical protein